MDKSNFFKDVRKIIRKIKESTFTDPLLIILIIIGIVMGWFIFLPHYLNPGSNQHFSFSGSSDAFNFIGESTAILFKAKEIYVVTNDASFNSVKNITFENYSGGSEKLNSGNIRIEPCINVPTHTSISNGIGPTHISISDANVNFDFDNLSLIYNAVVFKNRLYVNGYLRSNSKTSEPIGRKVTVRSGCNISINGNIPRIFPEISFEMDNTSFTDFRPGWVMVDSSGSSDVLIESDLSLPQNGLSEIYISQSNGKLALENHLFDINGADEIYIKVLPNSNSFLKFQDKAIIFNGGTNSVIFNNRSIIMSDFPYWLEYQPEKIIGFGVLVSAYLTLFAIYLPYRIEIQKKNYKKQRTLKYYSGRFRG